MAIHSVQDCAVLCGRDIMLIIDTVAVPTLVGGRTEHVTVLIRVREYARGAVCRAVYVHAIALPLVGHRDRCGTRPVPAVVLEHRPDRCVGRYRRDGRFHLVRV